MTTAAAAVDALLLAASQRDYAAVTALVTDDVEYQNMMLPAVHGPQALGETLDMLLSMCTASEWVTHVQVADGDTVLNERTDRFEINGTWVELPVAGAFVVRDGRVARWRDYFDLQTFMTAAFPEGGGPGA